MPVRAVPINNPEPIIVSSLCRTAVRRVCVFFLVLGAGLWPVRPAEAAIGPVQPQEYGDVVKKRIAQVKTIVIDPGHGGNDEGAAAPGSRLKEKDVALKIALVVRDELIQAGFRVIMTRQDDRYVSLQERARLVNSQEADFFLSIHANAAKTRLARGFETFYLSDPVNDAYDPEKMPDESYLRYEFFYDDHKELGRVLLTLMDKASSEDRAKSIDLAEMIRDAMKAKLHSRDRGVKRARFFVLKKTDIPAVLVEVGFLSNPKDENLLKSLKYQKKIAQAIAQGLILFREKQACTSRVVEK